MPIYEFECRECEATFEKLVLRYGDISEVTCKACGSKDLTEKVSAFASVSRTGSSGAGSSCAPSGG